MKEIEMKMNEMCTLLDLSAQGVRLYEKYGLIHAYVHTNGYRYYYFEDLAHAVYARSLKKAGFTLEECETGHSLSSDSFGRAMKESQERIRENIAYQQALLEKTEEMQRITELALKEKNMFYEGIRPAMYFLDCEENGHILNEKKDRELIRNWSSHFPFVSFCPYIAMDDLSADTVAKIGYACHENEKIRPDLSGKHVRYLPETRCICGFVSVSKTATDYYSVVEPGLKYMKEHGYELKGDIYTEMVAADIDVQALYFAYFPY